MARRALNKVNLCAVIVGVKHSSIRIDNTLLSTVAVIQVFSEIVSKKCFWCGRTPHTRNEMKWIRGPVITI